MRYFSAVAGFLVVVVAGSSISLAACAGRTLDLGSDDPPSESRTDAPPPERLASAERGVFIVAPNGGADRELRVVSVDGSSRSILKDDAIFDPVGEARDFYFIQAVAAGDYVLVSHLSTTSPCLLARISTGEVIWRHTKQELSAMVLDRSGIVGGSYSEYGPDGTSSTVRLKVLGPSGDGRLVSGGHLASPRNGFLPIFPNGARQGGWLKLDAPEQPFRVFEAPSFHGAHQRAVFIGGGRFIYLEETEGHPQLTIQSPHGTARIALPDDEPTLEIMNPACSWCGADVPSWPFIRTSGERLIRVDPEKLTQEKLELSPPDGVRWASELRTFDVVKNRVQADSAGRLYRLAENDDHYLVLSSEDGRAWQRVGKTISRELTVSLESAGETLIVRSRPCIANCGVENARPPSLRADVTGAATQFVNPVLGRVTVLPELHSVSSAAMFRADAARSDDGRYLAWKRGMDAPDPIDGEPSTLHIVDTLTGESHELLLGRMRVGKRSENFATSVTWAAP